MLEERYPKLSFLSKVADTPFSLKSYPDVDIPKCDVLILYGLPDLETLQRFEGRDLVIVEDNDGALEFLFDEFRSFFSKESVTFSFFSNVRDVEDVAELVFSKSYFLIPSLEDARSALYEAFKCALEKALEEKQLSFHDLFLPAEGEELESLKRCVPILEQMADEPLFEIAGLAQLEGEMAFTGLLKERKWAIQKRCTLANESFGYKELAEFARELLEKR